MLTNTAVTLGSLVINLKASSMACAVAPPPQSTVRRTLELCTKEVSGFATI